MKSFKQLIAEVAQPKSEDELNFKAKHEIDIIDHPESEEEQHSSNKTRAKRRADYDDGEDMAVYEAKMTDDEVISAAKTLAKNGKDAKTREFGKGLVDYHSKNGSFTPAQVGGLQNIMKNASFQLAKEAMDPVNPIALRKDFKDRSDKDIDNDGDVDDSDEYLHNRRRAIKKAMKKEALDPVDQKALKKDFKNRTDKDIDNDGDVDDSDEYLHNRRKAISKAIKKESVLDEVSLGLARKVRDRGFDQMVGGVGTTEPDPVTGGKTSRFVAPTDAQKTAAQKGVNTAQLATRAMQRAMNKTRTGQYEEVEQFTEVSKKTLGSYINKAAQDLKVSALDYQDANKYGTAADSKAAVVRGKKRGMGIQRAVSKLTKEESELSENFKVGSIKLDDGSSVIVKKQDAELLNTMFDQLNASNKKEMLKVAMADKKSFGDLLGFAKEAL